MWELDAVAVLAAAAVLLFLAVTVRRYLLSRASGAVEMSLRLRTGRYGRGWVLGVARYDGERLQWYRVFSLAPRPRRTLLRSRLQIRRRRVPGGPEAYAVNAGAVVLECSSADGPVELAMTEPAVTGFLAWLEAVPPGAARPDQLI